MGAWGLGFVLVPQAFASFLSDDPDIIALAAKCLFIAGFIQPGFAATMVFDGTPPRRATRWPPW